MSQTGDKKRANLWVSPDVHQLIVDHAEEWGVNQGEAVDWLVTMAVGRQAAERQAAAGLGAMEEMLRRVFGDFAATVNADAQRRERRVAIETSITRLLLFALLCHLTDERKAVANEDAAKRVAEQGYADGEIPLLLREKAGLA